MARPLRPQLGKYAVTPLLGRNWERGIFACSLCTEYWSIAMGRCSCTDVKTTSLLAIICDLQMQAPLIIRARSFTCLNFKGSHKSWDTTSRDKLLPDRYWQLGFVGARGREGRGSAHRRLQALGRMTVSTQMTAN